MRALKHLNKYFYRYRARLLFGILFVGLNNFFAVYSIKYVQEAVDYVAKHKSDSMNEVVHQMLVYGSLIIGMALTMGLFMFFMRQTIIVMSRLIEYDLKNEVYEHYQKLDLAFYKRNNTGDLMNRISEDVSRVRMYIGPAIMYIVNTFGTFVLTIIYMMRVDVKLSLFTLSPLPVLAISIYYVSDRINKKSNKVQAQLSDLSTHTQEAFSGIRVLKAYVREDAFYENFEKESRTYRAKNLSLVRTESLFQPFMITLIGLSTILTIYIGGMEYLQGRISMGNITAFVMYINRLVWPIASLGWVTSLVQRAAASQARINEFLDTKPTIENNNPSADPIKGKIEFRNVSFTYQHSGIKALDGVSFTVKPGESLAVIGRTGSGKSSIAALVTRLYDTTSGEILVDDKDIKKVNLYSLRSQTGYVPQEVFLFSDTIANNIAFTSERSGQSKTDEKAVEQAAKDAVIWSNIMEFPEKFETTVGERGITLSGGQKQRISIARAIIKQPSILIFDDCLSAVDTETEEEILKNLQRIMKGRTTIIISHRVSSVKNCDQVIVMDNGKIVEQGNHQTLLTKKGIYYELYHKQVLEEQKM
ncbi:MAG TPA: ABC transporter ATP-binding protein [Bacteroidia bacterium]|jgi:ATP-binding cassette subfamily B protein